MNKKQESYIALPNNTIGVPLTMGKMAIIDADDFDKVCGRRWQTKIGFSGKTFYARCSMIADGKRRSVTMHSIILPKVNGKVTDHIDGNGLNNTKKNLRYATRAENAQNRIALRFKNRPSQYKGVGISSHWREGTAHRKWRVDITVLGKRMYVGTYHDEIEAAKAYDREALRLHGEFARLNFPFTGAK